MESWLLLLAANRRAESGAWAFPPSPRFVGIHKRGRSLRSLVYRFLLIFRFREPQGSRLRLALDTCHSDRPRDADSAFSLEILFEETVVRARLGVSAFPVRSQLLSLEQLSSVAVAFPTCQTSRGAALMSPAKSHQAWSRMTLLQKEHSQNLLRTIRQLGHIR